MLDLAPFPKEKLNRKAIQKALLDPETFATVLHAVCLIQYGEEIYDLASAELYLRLKEDFGVWPCEECENKLQAIMRATESEVFYEDLEVFRSIVHTLLDGDPEIDTLEDMTLTDIYWAVYEVELNHGEEELSDEIKRLVAREVGEEADDYTGLDELRPNYVLQGVAQLRQELAAQLRQIGLKDADLPDAQ